MPDRARLACLSLVLLCACGGALQDQEGEAADPTFTSSSCRGAPYPILLAHGMAGWDKIGGFWNYYFQVADDLRARGERIYTSQVAPFESSSVRGAQLAQAIDAALRDSGACKINIIAHSQGGIDARHAISTLRRGGGVASLVTVSTPHRGTVVADVALGLIPGIAYGVINTVLQAYEALVGAPAGSPGLQAQLRQLSSGQMQGRFNPANPDDSRVAYYSVAGRSALRIADPECQGGVWGNPQRSDILDPILGPVQVVFSLTSRTPLSPAVNDGLVTVESARWGRFLGCVPADHLDEIGQILRPFPDPFSGFDHKQLYRRIAAQLHRDGF